MADAVNDAQWGDGGIPPFAPSSPAANIRLAEYLDAVADRQFRKPHERVGQAHFNVLYFDQHDPEFADSIRGGPLDPFYLDERIPAMLDALRSRWGV